MLVVLPIRTTFYYANNISLNAQSHIFRLADILTNNRYTNIACGMHIEKKRQRNDGGQQVKYF